MIVRATYFVCSRHGKDGRAVSFRHPKDRGRKCYTLTLEEPFEDEPVLEEVISRLQSLTDTKIAIANGDFKLLKEAKNLLSIRFCVFAYPLATGTSSDSSPTAASRRKIAINTIRAG